MLSMLCTWNQKYHDIQIFKLNKFKLYKTNFSKPQPADKTRSIFLNNISSYLRFWCFLYKSTQYHVIQIFKLMKFKLHKTNFISHSQLIKQEVFLNNISSYLRFWCCCILNQTISCYQIFKLKKFKLNNTIFQIF